MASQVQTVVIAATVVVIVVKTVVIVVKTVVIVATTIASKVVVHPPQQPDSHRKQFIHFTNHFKKEK